MLYAEWTKFWTVRGWVIVMIISALLTGGFGIWVTSGAHGEPCGVTLPGVRGDDDYRRSRDADAV